MSGESDQEDQFNPPTKKSRLEEDLQKPPVKAVGLLATQHGINYQTEILMHFAFRAAEKNYDFCLRTEVEEANKFDDLVLRYKEGEKNWCRFLQAKHKLDETKTIRMKDLFPTAASQQDDDFALPKYFASYHRIKKESKFFKGDIKDLIICTNIGLCEDLQGKMEQIDEPDAFLCISKNVERYKFKQNDRQDVIERLKDIFSLKNLAKRMGDSILGNKPINFKGDKLFEYHAESLVGTVIVNEKFSEDFIGIKSDFRDIFLQENFNNRPKSSRIKTEKDFLNELKKYKKFKNVPQSAINNPPLNEVTKEEIDDFLNKLVFVVKYSREDLRKNLTQELSLKFNLKETSFLYDSFLVEMKKLLDAQVKNHFICEGTGAEKFWKFVQDKIDILKAAGPTSIYRKIIKNYGLFFNDNTVGKLEKFLKNGELNILNLIVKETKIGAIKVDQAVDNVSEISQNYKKDDSHIFINLKNLLICNDLVSAFVSDTNKLLVIECDNIAFEEEKLNSLYDDLENSVKKKGKKLILISSEEDNFFASKFNSNKCKVQDGNDRLTDLTDESREKLLDSGKVLFQNREVILGSLFDTKGLQSLISGEMLLKLANGEVIKLPKSDKNEIKNGGEINDFYIERTFTRKVVEGQNEYFIWNQSKIDETNEKVIIIQAEPGMGKSTLLNHLEMRFKKEDFLWVERINLVDHSTWFKQKNQTVLDVNLVFDFFSNALKLTDGLETELFNHMLNDDKVILLFDGFDEISPKYNEKVSELMQFLKNAMSPKKMYVTTRPYGIVEDLKRGLCAFSYKLEQFSYKNVEDFCDNFWNKKDLERKNKIILHFLKSDCSMFLKLLLEYFESSLNDRGRNRFVRIPGNTYMIAEVFQNEFNYYINKGRVSEELEKQFKNSKMNLVKLYEGFVDKKITIFLEQKLKVNTDNPMSDGIAESKHETLKNDHQKLALYSLFELNQLEKLLNKNEIDSIYTDRNHLLEKIQNANEKMGIVDRVVDGKPIFIHKTFAEYFCACWFAGNNVIRGKEFLTGEIFFSEENQVIRRFFDELVVKDSELHSAVLNEDIDGVHKLLSDDKALSEIDSKDKAGRTALHLASAYGYEHIVKQLLDSGAKVEIEDKLGWTPLRYADRGEYWKAVGLILNKIPETDINDIPKLIIKCDESEDFNKNLFDLGVREGYVKLVERSLMREIDVNFYEIIDEKTPLHVVTASASNLCKLLDDFVCVGILPKMNYVRSNPEIELKIVKSLVEKGANIFAKDSLVMTPFHYAAQNGRLDILEYFMEYAVADKLKVFLEDELSVLLHVTLLGNYDDENGIMKYLVEKGANVNARNAHGLTVLQLAILTGRLKVVEFLLEKGVDVSVKDELDMTVLHYAAACKRFDIFKCLVEHVKKSDIFLEFINAKDKHNRSVVHFAVYNYERNFEGLQRYIVKQFYEFIADYDYKFWGERNKCIKYLTEYKKELEGGAIEKPDIVYFGPFVRFQFNIVTDLLEKLNDLKTNVFRHGIVFKEKFSGHSGPGYWYKFRNNADTLRNIVGVLDNKCLTFNGNNGEKPTTDMVKYIVNEYGKYLKERTTGD